jgi:diguanylate cyclase (GGDEF)-like protein
MESPELTLDTLYSQLEEANEILEKKGKDETGGKRETLYHRSLGKLVKECVDFTGEEATLKPQFKDVAIVTVTGIELQRANSKYGHSVGDRYLKRIVEETQHAFEESGHVDIFHRAAQDFSCIVNNEHLTRQLQVLQDTKISFGSETYNISVTSFTLSSAVDYYNRFMQEYDLQTQGEERERLQTRVFTELMIKSSEHSRETKKTLVMGYEYLYSQDLTAEEITNFNENVQYIFRGTRYEQLNGFKLKEGETFQEMLQDFTKTCIAIANRNVLGEEHEFYSRWRTVLMPHVQDQMESQETEEETENQEPSNIPKMPFTEFNQTRKTEKKKQIDMTRQDISQAFGATEELLKLNESLRNQQPEQGIRDQELQVISDLLEQLKQIVERQTNYFKDAQTVVSFLESIGDLGHHTSKEKLMRDFEDLVRFRIATQIAETNLNIELSEVDPTTGLPNKTSFERRLLEIHTQETNGNQEHQLLMCDLGFLKYFNKEGNRRVGDLAIQTAGSILQSVADAHPGAVGVFRTGGDEFALIIDGNELLMKKIAAEIEAAAIETGAIPSNGSNIGKYLPERIQFNIGSCTKEEAVEALNLLLSSKQGDFSHEDAERLTPTSESFDRAFYAKTLGSIQTIRADMEIGIQKLDSRVSFLRKLLEEGHTRHFQVLFPYSGKSLHGLTAEDLRQLHEDNKDLPDQEFLVLVQNKISDFAGLSEERLAVLDKVVAQYQREIAAENLVNSVLGQTQSSI